GAVVPGGRRPDAAGERSGQLLPDLIVIHLVVDSRVVLAHRVAVDDVEVAVLAGSDREVAGRAAGVDAIRQQHDAARAEVDIAVRFGHLVVHREVVGDGESAAAGSDLYERVAVVAEAREAVRESRIEVTIGGQHVDVAGRVRGRAAARYPDRRA